MYKHTPEPKNRAAKASALMTLIGGAFLFVVAGSGAIPYPLIAQTVGIAFLTFSILITSSYLLKRYTFIVGDLSVRASEQSDYDFVIVEHRSKREIKVCHVSVQDIEFIREVNPKNKKDVSSDRRQKKRYTYDTTFLAEKRLEIAVAYPDEGNDEKISIFITYDEDLLNALLSLGVTKK